MKGTDHFKRTIQMFLEQRAAEDELFAKSYRNPAKNIDDCVTYILNYVQKSGCNGFSDGEIYGQAIHYYDENEIEVGKPIQCQVVVNHVVELTEEDIKSLLSSPIVENPDTQFGYIRDIETIGFAKFHNFKKKASSPEPLEKRDIQRFYLFRSGKAFVTNMDEPKSCREVHTKDNDKAIFEASIDCFYLNSPSPYEFGYTAAIQNGIQVRTCQFCKYHRSGYEVGLRLDPIFCCLYKKYGTPENPEPQYAHQCQYYREDKELMDKVRRQMPPIVIANSE